MPTLDLFGVPVECIPTPQPPELILVRTACKRERDTPANLFQLYLESLPGFNPVGTFTLQSINGVLQRT